MFRVTVCVVLILKVVSSVVPDPARFSTSRVDHVVPRNVTPLCLSHTTHWMSQLRQGEPWALKMLDAWTKMPSGVLLGSNKHLGNYGECMSVSVQDEVANFRGQYFRALSQVEFPGLHLLNNATNAFCIPSTCTVDDIPLLMNEEIGPRLGIDITIWSLNPVDIHVKKQQSPLPTGALIFVILACLFTGTVLLSAIVEWRLGEKTPALVQACSLTSTCRSLFNTRKHPSDISCLHGLRVGSILWIIMGHHYIFETNAPISNPDYLAIYFQKVLSMTIANGMPAVDTFFFLSGLLMCISFFNEVKRSPAFDVIKFYVYRYFRLTLPICVLIAFYISILPLMSDGAVWNNSAYSESKYCKANWWTNIIYVNNYIIQPGFGMCLGQTWYTAIDMQLSWLSPLVLLPLYHSPRAGLQLMTLLILISCFIPFTLTYIYHFPMAGLQVAIDIPLEGVPEGNFQEMIYNATHSRATPYLCGILFGYFYFRTKNQNIVLSKTVVYLGWAISTLLALTVVYSLAIPYQPGYVYNLVGSAFYAGFHRLAWSAVLIWIVFACIHKYGGVVDKILSWHLLLPMSRLTYCAFLVHFIPMIYDFGTSRSMTQYSDYNAVHGFFGDLIPVYLMAIVLYITIEGPVLALLKIMFNKVSGRKSVGQTKETKQGQE